MKKTVKLSLLLAGMLIAMAACDNGTTGAGAGGGGGGGGGSATYSGVKGSASYTLVITKAAAAQGNPFVGTWNEVGGTEKFTFDNKGNFELSTGGNLLSKGTCKATASSITFTFTHVWGGNPSWEGKLDSKWYTKADIKKAFPNATETDLNKIFPAPITATYTVNSTTLTLTDSSGTSTYTKSRSVGNGDNSRGIMPSPGDDFVLTQTDGSGTDTSSGTVDSFSNGEFGLKPNGGSSPFTVRVSGDNITTITGTVYFDNGRSAYLTVTCDIAPKDIAGTGAVFELKITGSTTSNIKVSFTKSNYTGTFNSGFGTSSSSVITVTNGKLVMKLGAPNYLNDLSSMYGSNNVTTSPAGAQGYQLLSGEFQSSDGRYILSCMNTKSTTTPELLYAFVYADRDATVRGTDSMMGYVNMTYNLTLKQGWNFITQTINANSSSASMTYKSSQTLPSGFNWVISSVD